MVVGAPLVVFRLAATVGASLPQIRFETYMTTFERTIAPGVHRKLIIFPALKLTMMKALYVVVFALAGTSAYGQSVNPNWKQELKANLDEFLQCTTAGDKSTCGSYVGESLKVVYRIDDFHNKKAGRYMTSAEIAEYLKSSDNWQSIGQSYDQRALDHAAELANSRKAVVAVYNNAANIGHIVLIIPGEMTTSGSWGLKVPAAASFFAVEPAKSFTDKALSFAFSKQMLKDVTLYARRY